VREPNGDSRSGTDALGNGEPMADSIHLQVAGVNLAISSPHSIIHQDTGPAYQPFLATVNKDPPAVDIHIRLELGDIPSTEGLVSFFSGQSWSMFQDGDVYYLKSQPPVLREPLWLARFDRDLRQVTVYCSESLIRERDGRTAVSNPVRYPLDMLLLMYILAQNKGMLVHAAAARINGRGFLFPGRSAAGKSTLSRLLVGRRGVELLSDDRIAVRKMDGEFRAFGTPWPGDAGIALNASVPLSGIFFMYHGVNNRITEINKQEALERLLPVTSIPWYDRDIVPGMLSFCEDLVSHVPAFELHFTPSSEVVDLLRELAST
jgi:hypothetical protein